MTISFRKAARIPGEQIMYRFLWSSQSKEHKEAQSYEAPTTSAVWGEVHEARSTRHGAQNWDMETGPGDHGASRPSMSFLIQLPVQ